MAFLNILWISLYSYETEKNIEHFYVFVDIIFIHIPHWLKYKQFFFMFSIPVPETGRLSEYSPNAESPMCQRLGHGKIRT